MFFQASPGNPHTGSSSKTTSQEQGCPAFQGQVPKGTEVMSLARVELQHAPDARGTWSLSQNTEVLRWDPAVMPEAKGVAGVGGREGWGHREVALPNHSLPAPPAGLSRRAELGAERRRLRPQSPYNARKRTRPPLGARPHPCFCGSWSFLVLGPPPPLPYFINADSRVQPGFPIPKSEWSPKVHS